MFVLIIVALFAGKSEELDLYLPRADREACEMLKQDMTKAFQSKGVPLVTIYCTTERGA